MSVPEEERIGALLGKLVEILRPLRFVVEPWEVFGCVRVVVLCAFVGDLRLLQANDSAANMQLRMILEIEFLWQRTGSMNAIDELFSSVEHSGRVGSFDDDCVAKPFEDEGLFRAGPE